MSVREVEKNTKNFLQNNYIEPIQYVLKTENIFPLDFNLEKQRQGGDSSFYNDDPSSQFYLHPDRVIRQELFTNYKNPIKTDICKVIPG